MSKTKDAMMSLDPEGQWIAWEREAGERADECDELQGRLDEMTKLDKTTDIDKLNKLAETFDKEADKMGKLIDEINTYCSES